MDNVVTRLIRKRHKLMEQARRREALIHGSLVHTHKKCGRKLCACEKGQLHPHIYLYQSVKGKKSTIYLSKREAKKIRANLKAYREVMDLLESISDVNIKVLKFKDSKQRGPDAAHR